MKLTDKAVKAAKPGEKPYRIFDGNGLYLDIRPTGSKYWRMKCRLDGHELRLAFGVYPKVSLAEAREKRQKAQELLERGKDPRYNSDPHKDCGFKTIAMDWFNSRKSAWTQDYATNVLRRLEVDIFPRSRNKDIRQIEPKDILDIIQAIDARGAPVKAKKVLQSINAIFTYAIITLQDEMRYSPATKLHVAISKHTVKHNPYLREPELPEFLKRLDEYSGSPIVKLAAKFLLLTMTRTQEMRYAKWEEIDWKEKVWKIPEARMKMRRPHWVPLAKQAIALLDEAKKHGDEGDYIFPSPIRRNRGLCENAVLYALYDMGYRGKLTGHGFRATASTILNERRYNSLAIERQLAHVDRNTVRASYNHAEFLSERREILQAWADLLDQLRSS